MHGRMPILAAVLTLIVLVLTAESQIFDTNFFYLAAATSLIAGDHPYRDFYEWGMPLAGYLSAAAQLTVGHRLIGEFLLQWSFIISGVAIAFHLGMRLSRSWVACLAMLPLTLVIVGRMAIYHYSKLFFFPVGIWAAWRYMDRPGPSAAALVGFITAVAFLFRHDYGVYLGLASVMACVLARIRVAAPTGWRGLLADSAAYAGTVAVVLAPWAIVVQANEGLLEYTRLRTAMYEQPAESIVYSALLRLNPVRTLAPPPLPPPTPAVVGFFWRSDLDPGQRQQLEQKFRLRQLEQPDSRGRPQYELPNVYDLALFELDPYIRDGSGFQWDRLEEVRGRLPTRDNAALWLEQMALLVPVLLLVSAVWVLLRHRGRIDDSLCRDACRMLLAGAFLAVVDSSLFRQPSYMVTVAPVTAALGARFLVAKTMIGRSIAGVVLLLTLFAAVVWARDSPLFEPGGAANSVSSAFRRLMASPPVTASSSPLLHYLYDCTAPGDRLLVAGSTPYQVNYYAQRPFAGHLFWREGWRSDPVHERQLLQLLRRQSVPVAFSTHDPVLDELNKYPAIREYFAANYAAFDRGRLLVDKRRQPVRTFGPDGYPCFR